MPRRGPATLASVAAFALYAATAGHDVIGGAGIDAAKFGYMSRILGVPHPPGYPLYMLIGWAFSCMPLGTLLFRMSVLSALFAAATVWLLAVLLETLGCAPIIAAAVALLAGAGRVFWSQSIIPEVYTLHTALVMGTLTALVAWRPSKGESLLYVADRKSVV